MLRPFLIGLSILIVILIADRLLLWMETKGWIYWRRAKGRQGGAMTGVFLAVQEMVEPGAKEAAEHRLAEKETRGESGEPLQLEPQDDDEGAGVERHRPQD